ncbi:MAG TPA: HisA/HisF family protein [Methanobacterium sp.]|nr:HisA/HisF family protein [Methanobacterium sp.]
MIIPVLDLKNGTAVSGKSGNRETYKPLKTVFHDSSSPLKIAMSLNHAGASRIYIADLDSIEGKGSNFEIVKNINEHISVMLDCGASNIEEVGKALEAADKVIVATETLKNIEDLNHIFNSFPKDKLIISIDVKNGKLFSKYLKLSLEELITKIKEITPPEVILLDITKVGSESGVNTELIDKINEIQELVIIGGGMTEKDILQLKNRGINKFLVGSALHNGKLNTKF